ncbi:MAG: 2-amino-4-hydroxy-6-hydroxymethyldihydropteridine diphosphokinase [Planctomycetes bacterium]|nr:2-amino-4-hydroxy-6-hydroxymethyldihydropteridine diphosphokinase [Planctomycetota bacterium]
MSEIYVGLGSNLGDRGGNLRFALRQLDRGGSLRLRQVSTFRRTAPVGGPPQPDFVNAVARFETSLAPLEVLRRLQDAEARRGRRRRIQDGPRTLDLDLLLYPGVSMDGSRLTLPHPRLHQRRFVLEPLAEIAPSLPLAGGRDPRQCLRALPG